MNTLQRVLRCDGRTDPLTYQRNVALLCGRKALLDLIALPHLVTEAAHPLLWSWLNPFALVRPWADGTMPLVVCAVTLIFFSLLVWHSVHRARDAGWPSWAALASALPFVNVLAVVTFSFSSTQRRSFLDL